MRLVDENALNIELPSRQAPLLVPWPTQDSPVGWMQFHELDQWRTFLRNLDLDTRIPEVVRAKYARAQKLYFFGWIDGDLIKAGELVALTALELALVDRYRGDSPRRPRLAALLRALVEIEGLTDAQMPIAVRSNGSVLGQLTGASKPTLAEIRNSMAHGDPFDGLPFAGLLELVRDLITFAYRNFVAQHQPGGFA